MLQQAVAGGYLMESKRVPLKHITFPPSNTPAWTYLEINETDTREILRVTHPYS